MDGCSSPIQLMVFIGTYLHSEILPCNIYLEKKIEAVEVCAGVTTVYAGDGLSLLQFPKTNGATDQVGYVLLSRYTLVVGPLSHLFLCNSCGCNGGILPELVRKINTIHVLLNSDFKSAVINENAMG